MIVFQEPSSCTFLAKDKAFDQQSPFSSQIWAFTRISDEDLALVQPLRIDLEDFNLVINWPVGDNSAKTTSSKVYDEAGISAYKLWEYNGFWKYILEFENNVNYNFEFTDEEGDTYGVSTAVHGWHYVRYDSGKPTIVRVKNKNSKAKEMFG